MTDNRYIGRWYRKLGTERETGEKDIRKGGSDREGEYAEDIIQSVEKSRALLYQLRLSHAPSLILYLRHLHHTSFTYTLLTSHSVKLYLSGISFSIVASIQLREAERIGKSRVNSAN